MNGFNSAVIYSSLNYLSMSLGCLLVLYFFIVYVYLQWVIMDSKDWSKGNLKQALMIWINCTVELQSFTSLLLVTPTVLDRWSTRGYYIIYIASKAGSSYLFLTPAFFSAVLKAQAFILNQGHCLLLETDCDLRQLQSLSFSLLWGLLGTIIDTSQELHGNKWGNTRWPVTYVVVLRQGQYWNHM